MLEERMPGYGRHECVTHDAVEFALTREMMRDVGLGLDAEDNRIIAEHDVAWPQAFEIEVGVDAAEPMEDEVPRRIRPHDGLRIRVVSAKKPGVIARYQIAIIGIR